MPSPFSMTIHRGTHVIGGSCVELACGGSRIIIDLGKPLMKPGGAELNFRRYEGLSGPELLDEGMLPDVAGLYEWQAPSVAALLISHAHQDHSGFLNHVHPDIPVYLGEGTKRLIEVNTDFTPSKLHLNNPVVFSWPGSFTVGAFRVIPHLVDHSSFGSFAFEIEAGGRRVFYSGDFRDHGYIGGKTLDIIADKCAPGVDALLMEGTMLGRTEEKVQTEQELADEVTVRYRDFPKALLVYQSGQNVSRAVSFYKAARKLNRELVLDFYTAHVLAELGQCSGGSRLPYPGNLDGIRVWYPHWLMENRKKAGRWDLINRFSRTSFKMSRNEMPDKLDKIMLYVRPPMDYDLERIRGIGGSVLLYSLWSGYLKAERTKSFVDRLQSMGIEKHIIHTSGHAPVATLQRLVDILRPRMLFPIHTLHPEQYKQFGVEVETLEDGEVKAL